MKRVISCPNAIYDDKHTLLRFAELNVEILLNELLRLFLNLLDS